MALSAPMRGMTPADRFKNAKVAMKKSFKELLEQVIQPCCEVTNSSSLPRETTQDEKLKDMQKQLEECRQKVLAIMPILERDKMKAVVFGCISSGKSSLINAMLGDDVLPTCLGVCSSCLVLIEGNEKQESYLTLPSGDRTSVEALEELGNELEDVHLGAGDIAVVHWPKSKCELLKNEIQICDSPGISSNPDIDKVVNDECADADVHIFVVDSGSSITTQPREYFINVAKNLSKPNIFFVFNKWDESANIKKQERIQKVREQHIKSAKDLMRESLNPEEEEEFDAKKIFFVSAREILWAKTKETGLLDGHEDRKKEFYRFLEELQKSVSDHAIQTKFGQHCNEGVALCDRLDELAEATLDCLNCAMNNLDEERVVLIDEVSQLNDKQHRFGISCEKVKKDAKKRLEIKVKEKKDELKQRLDEILHEIPFEEDKMEAYKLTIFSRLQEYDNKLDSTVKETVTQDLTDTRKTLEASTTPLVVLDWKFNTSLSFSNDTLVAIFVGERRSTEDDIEGVADIGDSVDSAKTPSIHETKFELCKPTTTLSDAAIKDLGNDSPSYTDNMAGFRRLMSSDKAKFATIAVSALGIGVGAAFGSTGIGAGFFVLGSGAVGIAKYLENKRQAKRKQNLEKIRKKYETWLDDQEREAQIASLAKAEILANNIKTTFDEKIAGKVDAKRNSISIIDRCVQQLRKAFDNLKIYRELQLQDVKKGFEEFHCYYLQKNDDESLD